ncbi:hypothetical protein GCM10029963_74370 [Micromonospora andamanensis]|uniref:hypothetical protein n=1 Tax=Micromonospora andamanensis TaxID=1287068 RepID=UPI0019514BE7|nr:hypothetical protein [Micromonospora andamanensis]GIJ39314.1 hypothetical protein Vwe01_26390 [Micromonospora andamanensis]
MSDVSLPEQIRLLRLETTAAIAQRETLAVEARSALIAALENRLICRPGCEDALAEWGLEPLPQRWTVCAEAVLSYTRSHTDDQQAREQARFGVPDEVRRLDPAVAVYPRQVVEVTREPGGEASPTRYRLTVRVDLQTWATATRAVDAQVAAQAAVQRQLPVLAAAGIMLTGLTWHAVDSADDGATDTGSGARTAGDQLDDDLAAAIAARDGAFDALASLRRRIRSRAIRALVDDEFGGSSHHVAPRVDGFLTGLGLDALPRAHHVIAVADLVLLVAADTAEQACEAVRDTMRVVTTDGSDETRSWCAYGWTDREHASVDRGRWRVPWRHEYEIRLRDQATSADAAAAAELRVEADLTRALTGVDHQLITVTATVETAGIDLCLDPDRD